MITIGWSRVAEVVLYAAMLCVAALALLVAIFLSNVPPWVALAYTFLAMFNAFWACARVVLLLASAVAVLIGPRRLRKRVAVWYIALTASQIIGVLLWNALLDPAAPWIFLVGLAVSALALVLPVSWFLTFGRTRLG